jgi:hypothetical protein
LEKSIIGAPTSLDYCHHLPTCALLLYDAKISVMLPLAFRRNPNSHLHLFGAHGSSLLSIIHRQLNYYAWHGSLFPIYWLRDARNKGQHQQSNKRFHIIDLVVQEWVARLPLRQRTTLVPFSDWHLTNGPAPIVKRLTY